MADEGNSNLTEAERRRVRRRQRILENQGARMEKILGGSNSSKSFGNESIGATNDEVDSIPSSTTSSKFEETKKTLKTDSILLGNDSSTGNLSELLKELSKDLGESPSTNQSSSSNEVKLGVQSDGSVILPRIPHKYGQILLFVLAVFLSLMNARQFAITFISWEVAYYFMNGLPPYPPPNTVVVALALFGMKETQLKRLKKIMHMLECAFLDFAIFLTAVMMPHIIRNLIQQLQDS